ncbi:DUF5004 domain-containing protein [Sphingobacterium multivorum]|uniref:DUF5004 domain-containing protein n=1 Tax=Sphingobacterium multivorum TaxID=28454 RepID=UPI0028B20142|nr:DUF5004 domain-containing protein [Sphingobacterium multivorum]
MKIYKILSWSLMLVLCMGINSCKDELGNIPTEEAEKDITGKWQVTQLTRNGEDLSKRLALDNFKIDFNADGTYTIADNLPFVVSGSGKYRLDDPQYPFSVVLSPAEGKADIVLKFQFPVVKGKRQLSLVTSLGCSSNTYQYDCERLNGGI